MQTLQTQKKLKMYNFLLFGITKNSVAKVDSIR